MPVEGRGGGTGPAGAAPKKRGGGWGPPRRRGAVGGPAGNAAWRPDIRRRAVMRIRARDAVEELVANRLAGDGRARRENLRDCIGMPGGRLLSREPFWIAAAGSLTGNVVHVLDDRGESGERTPRSSADRRLDSVWNEKGFGHAVCSLYQSRMCTPSHAVTPGLLNTSSKARRT